MKTGQTKWRNLVLAAAALGLSWGLAHPQARAQTAGAPTKVVLALADPNMTVAWSYVARGMGYWKAQGLDVEVSIIEGPAGSQAVLAGDAQFIGNNASTSLIVSMHHQPLIEIASTQITLNDSIVISKAAAAKTGIPLKGSTFEQRARALKGLSLAAGQANNPLDVYLKHVVALVGLDPEKDITRDFIDSTAAIPAMEAGRIDGFSGVSPWPQIAENHGTGVIWINGPGGDVPDLKQAAASAIGARTDYCQKNADICRKFLTGVKQAVAYMNAEPDKALAIIAPNLKNEDPAVLKASFDVTRAAITPGLAFTEDMFATSQKLGINAGLIRQQEALTHFDGITYTNAYLN